MNKEEARTLLGVDSKASSEDIKKAFRAKAMIHHPDKGGDEETFKKMSEAHDILQKPLANETSFRPSDDFQWADFRNAFWEEAIARSASTRENSIQYQHIFFGMGIEEAFKGGNKQIQINHHSSISKQVYNLIKDVYIRPGIVDGELVALIEEEKTVYRVFAKIQSEYTIDWGNLGNPFDRGNITKFLYVSPFKMILGGWEVVQMIDGGSVKVYIPSGSQTHALLKINEKGYWRGDKPTNRGHCFLRLVPDIKSIDNIPEQELADFAKVISSKLSSSSDSISILKLKS